MGIHFYGATVKQLQTLLFIVLKLVILLLYIILVILFILNGVLISIYLNFFADKEHTNESGTTTTYSTKKRKKRYL